jgi:hypothetical protein
MSPAGKRYKQSTVHLLIDLLLSRNSGRERHKLSGFSVVAYLLPAWTRGYSKNFLAVRAGSGEAMVGPSSKCVISAIKLLSKDKSRQSFQKCDFDQNLEETCGIFRTDLLKGRGTCLRKVM